MRTPAVHAVSLLQFAPFLAERDMDVLDFFSRLGYSPNIFQAHDEWIPRTLCLQAVNALATETGNSFAGAFLGDSVSIPDFGELGRRLVQTETVLTCCETAIRNLGLVHRGSRITARIERHRYILRFSLEGDLVHDPRQFILATLGVLRNIILLSNEPDMMKVLLSIPYDRRCSMIEECLGGNLEFGCDHNEIEIRKELLEAPINICKGASRANQALETTVNAALLISKRLPLRPPGIDNIAAALGLTRRTLQRRLAECGVMFSDLVDVTRRDIAIRRLLEEGESLKELSFDLGYSDQAHFTRSFRRWTGVAPSFYQRSGRADHR